MIPQEELERWANLYDLGHQNFDGLSGEATNARRELHRLLRDRYASLFPGFRRTAFRRIAAKAVSGQSPVLPGVEEAKRGRFAYHILEI